MTAKLSYTLTNSGLSVFDGTSGKHHTVSHENARFQEIIQSLRERDYDRTVELLDVASQVHKKSNGRVTIIDGEVLLDGKPVVNALTNRMLKMVDMGLDVTPMMNFMERLENNPSYRSREQLFGFLDACDLPILPDGRFLAYRSVKADFWDSHTGDTAFSKPAERGETFRFERKGVVSEVVNGETRVSMERRAVDDDPNNTCSRGLHVCSQGYGKFSQILIHVAVDPADVVSVPTDYNNSKMRVCAYSVLKVVEGFENFDKTPVYDYDGPEFDENEDDDDWCF